MVFKNQSSYETQAGAIAAIAPNQTGMSLVLNLTNRHKLIASLTSKGFLRNVLVRERRLWKCLGMFLASPNPTKNAELGNATNFS